MTTMKRITLAVLGVTCLLLTLSFFTTPRAFASSAMSADINNCSAYDYGGSGDATVANTATPPLFGYEGNNSPELAITYSPCSKTVELKFSNQGADFYQVITTVNGQWGQITYSGSFQQDSYDNTLLLDLPNVPLYSTYSYKVQSCTSHWYGSNCTDWSPDVSVWTDPKGICIQGFVWRGATSTDHVCVTPNVRDQAAYDNSQASSRIDPNGAYGPDTCIQGYVWREAYSGDHVCVTTDVRSQAAYDNSQAANRIIS